MNTYTKLEILRALDDCTSYNFFPDLEHGYFYTAGSRINLYADAGRWAIVFEKSGLNNRNGRAEIELNYFGNCLVNLEKVNLDETYLCNSIFLPLIHDEDFKKIETDSELVSKEAHLIKVRKIELPIEQDRQKYASKGIEIRDYDNPDKLIDIKSLVRYLDEANPEVFRASDRELRTSIPNDLTFLMKIDKWHHKSYSDFGGEAPSSYETFQLIADVLLSRNIETWRPSLVANNDWRNWPDAGGL